MADETPPAGDSTPNPAPPAADGNPPPATSTENQRPEWLPEALWSDDGFNATAFEQYRPPAADLPSAPDAYVLPTIENFDQSAIDPAFLGSLQTAAFAQGIGQEAFNGIITDYAKRATEAADAYFEEQQTALGTNAETRVNAVSTWLSGKLPADEASALRDVATNAKIFHALERIMNLGTAPGAPPVPPPPAAPADTDETIRALMATPAYHGKGGPRDPAVVKRVDDFFAKQYGGQRS